MGIIQAGEDAATSQVHSLSAFARMKHITRSDVIAEIDDFPLTGN